MMTGHTIRYAAGLSLFALLVLAAGCSPPPKKRQFNNILSRQNAQLESAAKDFYKSVEPLSTGQAVGGGPRGKLDACKDVLKKAQERFDDLSPPRATIAGRDLFFKYKDFLKTQHQIYDQCLVPIVEIVEDHKRYPNPGLKWQAIQPLLQKASALEKDAFDALIKSQGEYAEAHGFRPVTVGK